MTTTTDDVRPAKRRVRLAYDWIDDELPSAVRSPADARDYFDCMVPKDTGQEHHATIYVDSAHHVIGSSLDAMGSDQACIVPFKQIFGQALMLQAAGIIIIHNHPSGRMKWSPEDLALAERIKAIGDLVAVELVDSILVARRGCMSMKGFALGPFKS